ncbi:serine hydrolase [Luteipulveratus sp. YIM 133132]|uniref:serine hydrolase domain-containing protein n=1 Tax=Luteipulveratus flavus TaxID=3031728 RepID=UPI0023AFA319|nr:serine hydrolase domain-containing protein [Luteipulveratus sp. YIM 133132]MDE9367131.1 serine hydrolase [Luteipulveratus sp. YIM 133132]
MTATPATPYLDARLAKEQQQQRLPSIAAALVRGGQVVWSGAAGTVDARADGPAATPETQYRIGSITKSVVAVGVLRLVADGRVAVTDPIRRHLPELDETLDGVSVLQLLTQSAGLHAETTGPWWERSPGITWEDLLPSVRPAHDPGRRFHYSNVGYAVLGRLIEVERGRPWFEVLQEEVLRPLGMTRTSYDAVAPSAPGLAVHPLTDLVHTEPAHDAGAMAPAGQLWSTVGDLARFATFLQAGDTDVLPEELRRAMQVPTTVVDTPGQSWTRAYGIGLDVYNRDGTRFVGHGGSMPGFQAGVRVDPETGDGVTLLTNSTGGPGAAVAWDLLELLEQHDPRRVTAWHTETDATDVAHVVGGWHWGPRRMELRSAPGGELELSVPGESGRWSRFVPAADGTWTGTEDYWAGETLRAHGDGPRAAYLDLGSFRLTRDPYDPAADLPGGADPAGWHA